ncbi:MAG TPA: acyl carrier protein [Planctomycetes bacterium]|nr:acyl carrier protein [Planctomycetota bacterium]
MANIAEKVKSIVCEKMGANPEKLTESTSFINDLGADSLDTVELVMEFEEAFDINIPDEDAEKIQTVGDAVAYIEKHVA